MNERYFIVCAGLAFLTQGALISAGWTNEVKPVLISEGGSSLTAIVISECAIPSEVTAAKELSLYLEKITDVKFETVEEKRFLGGEKAIYVGDTTFARENGVDSGSLKAEESVLRTVSGNLILAGGRPRGTLYAVYIFLEDILGCRWYTPWCESVPKISNLRVKSINKKSCPAFSYRDQYTHLNDKSIYPEQEQWKWFIVRNKWNGDSVGCGIWWRSVGPYVNEPIASGDEVGGGTFVAGPGNHSFAFYFPAEQYFKEHPEYYSEREGKRVPSNGSDGNHLCLTNQDVLRIMTEKVKEQFKKFPSAHRVSVGINDGGSHTICDCARCREVAEKEGESGLLLQFVNQVADAIKEEYPDKYIITLAYNATALPPRRIVPRDNVIVYVCSGLRTGAVFLPKGTDSDEMRILSEWAKISKHIWGWDYVRNDYFPMNYFCPVVWKMDEQMKFARKIGMDGILQENELLIVPPVPAEFYEMRMWVAGKLMEDPGRNCNVLISDFLNGYYGKAGKHIARYVKMQKEKLALWPYRMVGYAYIRDAQSCFDEAGKTVKEEPVLLQRVREARICPDLTTLSFRHQILHDYLRKGGKFESYPYQIDILKERILDTLENAKNSYFLATPPYYGYGWKILKSRWPVRAQVRDYVTALCQGKEYASLPEQFQFLPPDKVIDITAPILANPQHLTIDPDSALGLTIAMMGANKKLIIGVYDLAERKTLFSNEIMPEENPNRGYRIYKGGRFSPGEWSYVYLTETWEVQAHLYTLFNPAKPRAKWDIYVSAKFTGPAYRHGNGNEPDGLYIDRVILVRVD